MKPIYSSGKLHLKKQNSPSLRTSKSINMKLPEPINYAEKIGLMQEEIARLNESLIYFRNRSESNSQLLSQNAALRNETEGHKLAVKKMSEQLLYLKRKNESQQQLRQKNIAQIKQLSKEINDYKREVESLNNQLQKLRRENVMDRTGKRSFEYHSYEQKFRNRQSTIMKNSRALSDLELLQGERFSIKLTEKNKEYEQLYRKYQSLQNDYTEMEETNAELERERKLLSDKLGRVQIHTEGEEADELQQKMALMSSEMMRLKGLSQTKTHQARELSMKVKELTLQKQNLQKEIIEKDKILLNYKQQLRLVELQLSEQIDSTQFREDQFMNEVREENARLKQENEHWSRSQKETMEKLKDTEVKNRALEESNQRLSQQNRDIQRQCRRLAEGQQKYRENQSKIINLQAEANYLQEANRNIKLQVGHLQNTVEQLKKEKGVISQQKDKVKQMSYKFQSNISVLQGELKKVRLRLEDKENQLRQVNNRFSQNITTKSNEIRVLEERTQILRQQIERGSKNRPEVDYERVLREAQQLERSSIALKQQLHQYQEQIALLAQENERLSERLKNQKQNKGELDRLRSELEQKSRRERELTKQISSVTMRQKVTREEAQSLREKVRMLEGEGRESEKWQFKNRQLTDQMDGLRTLLTVKETEVMNLQRYFEANSNKRSSYLKKEQISQDKSDMLSQEEMQNRNRMERELRLLQDQQVRDKGYIRQLQQKEEENNQNYRILSEQIERLNRVLEDKTIQTIQFKKDNDLLYHKIRTCQGLLDQRKTQDSYPQVSNQKQYRAKIQLYEGTIRRYESELQLLGQRCQSFKQDGIRQEARITVMTNQKVQLQQKVSELEYQMGDRSQHFRRVEESFRMTISQIKSSNQRLEHSLKQIETHYISKCEQKEYQCDQLRKQRQKLQSRAHELEKSILTLNETHNERIREKQQHINSLNSNHHQIKEETEVFKRMKNQYEAKLALLSQEVQRLNGIKQNQNAEMERLRQYNYENAERFNESMRQSTVNVHSIETLSQEIERLNTVLGENVQKLRMSNKRANMFEMEKGELVHDKQQEMMRRKQLQAEFQQYKQVKETEVRQLRDELSESIEKFREWEEKIKKVEERGERDITITTQNANEEIRKIADSKMVLEGQLKRVSSQYQYLAVQWEQLKKVQSSTQQDQKMRILSSYQSTIRQIKQENSALQEQRTKLQRQCAQLNKISYELQQRLRTAEQFTKTTQRQKEQLVQEISRLQKSSQVQKPQSDNLHKNKHHFSTDQLEVMTVSNSQELEHRCIMLQSINKKLGLQMQCTHKANVEYEFKMNKLKQEFTLLNRLVKEYREENDQLKQKNKGQRVNSFAHTHGNFRSPQHATLIQISHKNSFSPPVSRSDNFDAVRGKLFEEIDRLNRVNISLQNEVHDLRLLSTDNLSLRKRLQENAAVMVLLFVQIDALRLRLREKSGIGINSPRKSGISN